MSEGLVFYRCQLCRKVVSPWDLESKRGCPTCGHARVSPTNMSISEKVSQIIKHPALWKWSEMECNNPATDSPDE